MLSGSTVEQEGLFPQGDTAACRTLVSTKCGPGTMAVSVQRIPITTGLLPVYSIGHSFSCFAAKGLGCVVLG